MTNRQCIAKAAYSFTRCPRKVTTSGDFYCDGHLAEINKDEAQRHLEKAAQGLLEALKHIVEEPTLHPADDDDVLCLKNIARAALAKMEK